MYVRKQENQNMAKKKWSRPECERIKLVPEEAVLTGCKAGGQSGPSGIVNNCAGRGGPCQLPRS